MVDSYRPSLSMILLLAAVTSFVWNTTPADAQTASSNAKVRNRIDDLKENKVRQEQLVVKFHDDVGARADQGRVRFRVNDAFAQQATGWFDWLVDSGVRFEQLIQISDDKLIFLELRAAAVSGRPQPDLASMMVVRAPEYLLPILALELWASDLVQWVEFETVAPPPPYFQTACTDISPTTPLYANLQGYRGPNPGLNMNGAWLLGNTKGAGIRIADCEYGYNANHEDLCGIIPEPGQTIHPTVISNGWHEHGTAVMGEIIGRENNYGVTGLVPDAEAHFFVEWSLEQGYRRASCIANAIAAMDPGDVVLLEMQATILGGELYGPAELEQSVWTLVKNGTDAGIIVVGAAGNGNQNLDGPSYQTYRNRGDSGAIIVGAGSASTAHNKLSFSTYGSRVNVQGWGQSVFTTGYGSYSQIGGDVNQRYTASFSGTSSASPFIASCCVALQSYAVANIGRRLTPLEMREVLSSTGHPQGSGGNIGPFPNMISAAQYVINRWGQVAVAPDDFEIIIGDYLQGGLAALAEADGHRLGIMASDKWEPPIGKLPDPGLPAGRPIVQVEIWGTSPNEHPTSIQIALKTLLSTKSINQKVEVFNYQSLSFEVVDIRVAAAGVDQFFEFTIEGLASHYVQEGTRQLRARVTYVKESEVSSEAWQAWLDQFSWIVQN